MNKKVLITILITIILLIFSIILYPVIKNNNYQKKLLNNIYENTDLKDIKYLNKDNNYFIIKTKDKVIVLDLNYEEAYSISTSEIKKSNLEWYVLKYDFNEKQIVNYNVMNGIAELVCKKVRSGEIYNKETLKEFLKSIGLSRNTYQNRIMKGMPIKQALGLEN